jgi:hypothetical protein
MEIVTAAVFAVCAVAACKSSEKKPEPAHPRGSGGSEVSGSGGPVGAVAEIARPTGATLDIATFEKRRTDDLAALGFQPVKDVSYCLAPKNIEIASVDVHRSLFVHDRETLDALGPNTFSLHRTLKKIADDAVLAGATNVTAETLFRDLWDTQNPNAVSTTTNGAHCDFPTTMLNGFPNACRPPPSEGAQAKASDLTAEMSTYRPIGLVNRLDLAAEGWKNCGEHRIVYGRLGSNDIARNFIIFEAVLPNPRPGCQSGCRGIAEEWYALSKTVDPAKRAKALEQMFYVGIPGFRPVVHLDHYSVSGSTNGFGRSGGGQIRTNQFLAGDPEQFPWLLKEFKLALDCTNSPCVLDPVPVPVKNNPDGSLWTPATAGLANDFQRNIALLSVKTLADSDLAKFSYQVPVPFDAARSESQTGGIQDHYFNAYNATGAGTFKKDLDAAAKATPTHLTDKQIVNRALLMSCAGCHQPSTFDLTAPNAIGPDPWPDSAGFVHVKAEDKNGKHELSKTLTELFLPARAKNLASYLSEQACMCNFATSTIALSPPVTRPRTIKDLRDQEEKLKKKLDEEAVKNGQPVLPDLKASLKPQGLVLDEVRTAGSDPTKQAEARRLAVQKLSAEEPPRKTVTGHFRTE